MDPRQFSSGQFFNNEASFESTGLTPFLNGSMGDSNVFDTEYAMHQSMNGGFMNPAGTPMSQMDNMQYRNHEGMSFDPQYLSKSTRNYSSASSDSNTASASPQQRHHSRPMPSGSLSNSNRRSSASNEPEETGGNNSVKRNRFLERNRLAAAKCRTKKKEWTNNLEAAARQASQQTRELHAIVQNLRNEVLEHKTMLMSHQGCDCHTIHEYLMHDANTHGS